MVAAEIVGKANLGYRRREKKEKGIRKKDTVEGAGRRVFQRVFRRVFFESLSKVAGREKLLERAETCFLFS